MLLIKGKCFQIAVLLVGGEDTAHGRLSRLVSPPTGEVHQLL